MFDLFHWHILECHHFSTFVCMSQYVYDTLDYDYYILKCFMANLRT